MIRGGHRDETCKSARSLLVLSCRAGFITTVLAGISLFRACRFDGQSPTTLHALQQCLWAPLITEMSLCAFACVRVSVHVRAGTRAIELDRACAGTEPLRMRSQRFHSFVSLSSVLFYVIICLARMLFM